MRKRERERRLAKSKGKGLLFAWVIVIFFTLLISTVIYVWLKVTNLSKFSVVEKTDDGGGEIMIIDPKLETVVRYKINPDLVLNSAYGYGEYKLDSLWKLGVKEGLGGELVSKSIATNFMIPIYKWKDGEQSNLNLYQKIKLKTLGKSSSQSNETLNKFDLPNSILINFVNEKVQESGIGVEVEDLTGDPETIIKVSKIIGTLGTKVSGYTKGYDKDFDCEVYAKDTEIRNLVLEIFGCKGSTNENENKLKIKLGAKFADRF